MSGFKKGDVVKLKSGGPKMTVAETGDFGPVGPSNGVECTWFEKNKLLSEVFPEEVLMITDPEVPLSSLRLGRG